MEQLETFFTVKEQTQLFLLSCLFGIPIGIIFDIFRTFRIIVPHNKFFVVLEDILFFFIYAVFIVSFSVIASRGEFRFFYIIGNLIGFCIYFFTLGNLVTSVLRKLFNGIHSLLSKIFSPLNSAIYDVFMRFYKKISTFLVQMLKNHKFYLKKLK